MSERSEHIHIRVTPDTKRVWEQAVEEGRWKNRTHLIEDAVNRLLNDDANSVSGEGDLTAEINLDPVNERLDALNDRLLSLEGTVEKMAARVGEDGELTDLASEILRLLPRGDMEEIRGREVPDGTPREKARETGSASALIEHFTSMEYSEPDMYSALDQITENMSTVEVIRSRDPNRADRYFVRE